MIRTVNFHDFVDAFRTMGRADQFSFEALRLIFEYLEELEEDTGVQIELDPVAICCEWVELSQDDLIQTYGYLINPVIGMDKDEFVGDLIDELRDRTIIVEFDTELGVHFLVREF